MAARARLRVTAMEVMSWKASILGGLVSELVILVGEEGCVDLDSMARKIVGCLGWSD